MDPRLRVGILPAGELRARARLWAALEAAYPVRFEGCDGSEPQGVDAVIALGELDGIPNSQESALPASPSAATGVCGAAPLSERTPVPRLSMHGKETSAGSPRRVALASGPILARPLRGALLSDAHASALSDDGASALSGVGANAPGNRGVSEVVLGTLDGAPAWVSDAAGAVSHQRVACAPDELAPDEALRERLRPGRCLALLALAHFLADLTAHIRPALPALHAAFVIDDPNLRRPRYGHLDYAELLRNARGHGYHVAVAMVPLDARLAHPRAVSLFRDGAAHLSLCVHGNDHHGPELGRPRSDAEAMALVAQALRRTELFEQRTGVAVDRVMVPPHERLSEPVARALRACGFHAVTTTRPYPWVAESVEQHWLARPPAAGPLAAWRPVDLIADGLPVLLRADFRLHPREDLPLRAFLGQPLILYGHHDLLAGGPDALAQAAGQIDRLGEVTWSSLATIARVHAQNRLLDDPSAGVLPDRDAGCAIPVGTPVATPLPTPTPPPVATPSQHLRPLLRRLASEGRDRASAITTRR